MIPDLRSSRGKKSTTSEIGFYPGNLEERLTGGTQRTTGYRKCTGIIYYGLLSYATTCICFVLQQILLCLCSILSVSMHKRYFHSEQSYTAVVHCIYWTTVTLVTFL